jgi:hypothetical protein
MRKRMMTEYNPSASHHGFHPVVEAGFFPAFRRKAFARPTQPRLREPAEGPKGVKISRNIFRLW